MVGAYIGAVRHESTLIILPTVIERENLPRVAQKLLSLRVGVDVLGWNGNSSDGTGKLRTNSPRNTRNSCPARSRKKTGWAAPTSPDSNGH